MTVTRSILEWAPTKNVGIIGLGKMGILHAGIVNQLPYSRVQAICEEEKIVAGIAKKLLPKGVSYYDDHVEMAIPQHRPRKPAAAKLRGVHMVGFQKRQAPLTS